VNKVTDLISSNADENNKNDEVSQGVNRTQDKSHASLSGQYVKLRVGDHTIFTIVKLLSILCSALVAQHSNKCVSINIIEMALCYPLLHTLQTTHNVYVYCIIFQFIVESGVGDPSTPSNIEIGSPTAIGTNNPIL